MTQNILGGFCVQKAMRPRSTMYVHTDILMDDQLQSIIFQLSIHFTSPLRYVIVRIASRQSQGIAVVWSAESESRCAQPSQNDDLMTYSTNL